MRRSALLLLLVGGSALCSAADFLANFVIEDDGTGKARMTLTRADGQPHGLVDQQYVRLLSSTFTFEDGNSPGVTSETLMWLGNKWRATIDSPTEFEHIFDTRSCDTNSSCPSRGTVTVEEGELAPPSAPPSSPTPPDLNFLANFTIEDDGTGKARMRLTRADGQPHGLVDQQYARLLSSTFTFEGGTSPGVTSETLMWLGNKWRATIISPTVIEHIVDNLSCDASNSCPSSGTVEVEDGELAPPPSPPSPPSSPPPPPFLPAPSPPTTKAGNNETNLGLAIGLPLGGLFVVAVLTAIGCYYRRKPQTPNPTEPSQVAEVEISRA